MFDPHAQQVVSAASAVENIGAAEIRRTLSVSYFWLVSARLMLQAGDVPSRDRTKTINELRRLANTMESAAVFDTLRGVERDESEVQGAAFVGAEALALLADLAATEDVSGNPVDNILADAQVMARIEGGLMYMIGGFDINAVAVIRPVISALESAPANPTPLQVSSRLLARRVSDLCLGRVRSQAVPAINVTIATDEVYEDLVDHLRVTLFDRLSTAVIYHMAWLAGEEERIRIQALDLLTTTRQALQLRESRTGFVYGEFRDVYHLGGLLLGAFKATAGRSLVNRVPPPNGPNISEEVYTTYLRERASPTGTSEGRPLLWPSAIEYVNACLPGPHRDAVVTFPTGSGKSFVAELAISHALAWGWVLYLAPTNALCHQIRRDLAKSVGRAFGIPVVAFVGGEEYTTLAGEQVAETAEGFIAVMTPEKCALALRLSRDVFRHCRLCVLDECHLMNDERRGPTAEFLLADLVAFVPEMRLLLMSAMVANPDDLVGWLDSLRAGSAVPCSAKWRPSRTARSFIFLDRDQHRQKVADARKALEADTPKKARTIDLQLDLGWMVGLSGAWQAEGPHDYVIARLGAAAQGEVSRNKKGVVSDSVPSWKNTTGRIVAERFALAGLPTINFILSSRHHAFGQADKARGRSVTLGGNGWPAVVNAWLRIADFELGVPTVLRDLVAKGVGVHTSAMLPVEQAASTMMFSKGLVGLMFATGTLAQGLNLPALAVVVSGSSIGDPRESDRQAGLIRASEIILNGFGRAGRPGFSNQAMVVLVSDTPFNAPIIATLNPRNVLSAYPVLGEPDASVTVSSRLDEVLDLLQMQGQIPGLGDLEVFSSLVARDDGAVTAGRLLGSTYGGYMRRKAGRPVNENAIDSLIVRTRAMSAANSDIPQWLGRAAMNAGASFNHALHMWRAYQAAGIASRVDPEWNVADWYSAFIEVMKRVPPGEVQRLFAPDDLKTPSIRTLLRDLAKQTNLPDWTAQWSQAWDTLRTIVWRFMRGDNYRAIGSYLLSIPVKEINNKRTSGAQPIPTVFKFIREVIEYGLALDAGCFVSVHEAATADTGTSVPEPLAALPLCIRNGCDSISTLAWFRFGLRQRVCAHELARFFPIPPDIADDISRSQWVYDMRRMWLANTDLIESDVLTAARTIITSGEGF